MKTRTVQAPGEAVGSDEDIVYLEANYEFTPILPATYIDPEDGGVTLLALYWDKPSGLRVSVGWTDESWVDAICDQLYDAEGH